MTDEVQETILNALKLGMHFRPACELAGIAPQSVQYWLDLVESGAEHAQIYAVFSSSVKKAVAMAEGQSLATLKAGGMGWQAQAWFLERRFPKRWRARKDEPPPVSVAPVKVDIEVRYVDADPIDSD